jgi:hypothetical protein
MVNEFGATNGMIIGRGSRRTSKVKFSSLQALEALRVVRG